MVQTIVGMQAWVVHRDTLTFGADANEFKPERWLIDDKEKLSVMERNWMPVSLDAAPYIVHNQT